jgi:hypothetical protein
MIINMEKIKDLFEAYGIAVGIIIETTGCFLSSVGQAIIDRFQPPFSAYEKPVHTPLEFPGKEYVVPKDDPESFCQRNNISDEEQWVLDMGELEDAAGGFPGAGRFKHEDLGLSSPDPFNLKGICLGGDQPGLASEIAYLKRKRNGKN